MIRRPPRATRTDTLFPYTTLFRSVILFRPGTLGGSGFPAGSAVALVQGGNLDLKPERATNWSATLAIHPPSLSRSEEHTSELQSLMRISYAVFCLKKKTDSSRQINRTLHRIQQTQL